MNITGEDLGMGRNEENIVKREPFGYPVVKHRQLLFREKINGER
jgi:hypothetical protein